MSYNILITKEKKDMRGTCAPGYNSRRRRMVRDHGAAADRGRISLVGQNSEFNKENIVGLRLWHIFSLPASDNSWAYSIFFVIIWVLHPPVTFSYDAIWRGSSTCTIILSHMEFRPNCAVYVHVISLWNNWKIDDLIHPRRFKGQHRYGSKLSYRWNYPFILHRRRMSLVGVTLI